MNIQIELVSELYQQQQQNQTYSDNSFNCNVIIKLLSNINNNNNYYHQLNHQCPGVCLPIPYFEFPLLLLYPPYNPLTTLTCSLTLGGVISHHPNHFSANMLITAKINNEIFGNKSASKIDNQIFFANLSETTSKSENQISGNLSAIAKSKCIELILTSLARRRMEECTERVIVVIVVFSSSCFCCYCYCYCFFMLLLCL